MYIMKLNTDKCYLSILGGNSGQLVVENVRDSVIENTKEEKLLGVVIDKKHTSDMHVSKLGMKTDKRRFALACIAGGMDPTKGV